MLVVVGKVPFVSFTCFWMLHICGVFLCRRVSRSANPRTQFGPQKGVASSKDLKHAHLLSREVMPGSTGQKSGSSPAVDISVLCVGRTGVLLPHPAHTDLNLGPFKLSPNVNRCCCDVTHRTN